MHINSVAMNRRTLLQTAGLAGIASLLPGKNGNAVNAGAAKLKKELMLPQGGCVLIPQETPGPFPWPADGQTLSTDPLFFRRDVTEDRAGIPLNLTMTVVNINDNCNPILNAAVVIWHCDKDGNYSEFGSSAGKTFLRGIQMTDATGQVQFKTIYPGWYPGRTTHIHFQVFLSSHLSATSQMAFPEDSNMAVYSVAPYATRGQKDTANTVDSVFSDANNTQYEMVAVSGTPADGINGALVVGIDAPTSGVINLEPETGGQFKLAQNYPNPFDALTTIPFALTNPSNVTIELFDVTGVKVAELMNQQMDAGEHKFSFNELLNGISLSAGGYIYQITVENRNGIFRQAKVMTKR
jgi:protocatechuate 3,4-dioxygenase beta subunit